MSSTERLWEILKTEYNISTVSELEEAIKKQNKIDISVFCMEREKDGSGER